MSKFASKQFWVDTADRAVTSFAQGILGSGLLGETGIVDVDMAQIASLGASFAVMSILTSVAFRGRGEEPPPVPRGKHSA